MRHILNSTWHTCVNDMTQACDCWVILDTQQHACDKTKQNGWYSLLRELKVRLADFCFSIPGCGASVYELPNTSNMLLGNWRSRFLTSVPYLQLNQAAKLSMYPGIAARTRKARQAQQLALAARLIRAFDRGRNHNHKAGQGAPHSPIFYASH